MKTLLLLIAVFEFAMDMPAQDPNHKTNVYLIPGLGSNARLYHPG